MTTTNITVFEYFAREETLRDSGTGREEVVETFSLTERGSTVQDIEVEEDRGLTDESVRGVYETTQEDRGLTELLTYVGATPAHDARGWSEAPSSHGSIRSIEVVETFSMIDGVIERSSAYHPCDEPYSVSPALGTRELLTLTHPYVTPTTTVNLRVPLFGNSDESNTGNQVRRTTSNQLSVVRGAAWPTIRKTRYRFVGLTEAQRNAVLDFYVTSLGQEIGILDQENRQWRGVITSEIDSTQIGQGCDYGCSFEFQGRLA